MAAPARDISIVTAFFDINRGNWTAPGGKVGSELARSTDTYFQYFGYLAEIENEMVIYTSPDLAPKVQKLRDKAGRTDQTKVVVIPDFRRIQPALYAGIQQVVTDYRWHRLVERPSCPEHWNADYNLVMMLKLFWVADAIERGLVSHDTVAWIDFGYCRHSQSLCAAKKWQYDFSEDKIHLFNLAEVDLNRSILDIILTGAVYITGGQIVAHRRLWSGLRDNVLRQMQKLLDCGLCDDDQTLYLMAYRQDPAGFELHPIDKHKGGWFVVFRLFNACATAREREEVADWGKAGVPPEPGQASAAKVKIEKPITFKDCFRSLEQTVRLFRKRIFR